MDGEWPITLRQEESEAEYMGFDQIGEEYQADRGSDKDLPGGKKQHDERTKACFDALEEKANERSEA